MLEYLGKGGVRKMGRTWTGKGLVMATLLIVASLVACGGEKASSEEHFRLGNEAAQNGEFEQAIVEYEAVLKIEPDNTSALTNLGVVYYNTGQLELAIEQYDKALEIAPEDADIHSNLAAAHVQLNQLEEALSEYQLAAELDPDLPEARFGLGVVYAQLGDNEKAIKAFEAFQELDTGKDSMATQQALQYLKQLRGQ
jgi:Flp pilus assembly protein TadD